MYNFSKPGRYSARRHPSAAAAVTPTRALTRAAGSHEHMVLSFSPGAMWLTGRACQSAVVARVQGGGPMELAVICHSQTHHTPAVGASDAADVVTGAVTGAVTCAVTSAVTGAGTCTLCSD